MAQGSELLRVNQTKHICLTFFEGPSWCIEMELQAHIQHIQKFEDEQYLVHGPIPIVIGNIYYNESV